ncbi:MAG: quinolinate synthase NadA [Candidatus Coatesbacteria bacterium]|nr:quinolinate synthase NadA [Candidatus Coatesbacteria bacterium]
MKKKLFHKAKNGDLMEKEEIIIKISKLKQNSIILAHNYQNPEIQDISDYNGDSLQLARIAAELKTYRIIFCGVHFMAESAKILSPEKEVLIPRYDAGCQLADMITLEELKDFKKDYPDAAVVTYVNSSAEIKAESDICCTSSNAVQVVNSLKNKRILFIPDKNLGNYVKSKITDKEIIPWKGYCPTHQKITLADILAARRKYPDAKVMVHPECTMEVINEADFVLSTGGMLKLAKGSEHKEFIIGTEKGMTYRLSKDNPGKLFHDLSPKPVCREMKKIKLVDVLNAFEKNQYRIEVDEEISRKAKKALDAMLDIKQDKN